MPLPSLIETAEVLFGVDFSGSMEEQIYTLIKEYDSLTFFEIEEAFGSGNMLTSTEGLYEMNIVLWIGLSKDVANAIRTLHEAQRIEYVPCEYMTYCISGPIPQLPVAHRLPTKGYKKRHWLPVVIRVAESEKGMA